MTAEVGLSRRRLIEIFTEQIGMTPKEILHVLRFQRAINQIQQRRTLPWPKSRLRFGYYDQAHFINDFHRILSR